MATFWSNAKQNCGLADDSQWRRFVAKWALVSLCPILIAAYFSFGFYHLDEHYKIIELTSYKLGKTPEAELLWEYHCQSSPWLQPAIYYGIAKVAMLVGVENPFKLAYLFRLFDGMCCWIAVVSLMLTARVFFREPAHRKASVMILALLWLIPYLAVRTSCESLSCDLISIAVAALMLGSSSIGERREFPRSTLLIVGLFCGLAFDVRYQLAFAAVGIMGWVAIVASQTRRRGILNFAITTAGVVVALAIGAAVDRWGYGQWTLTPWNYFRTQLLDGIAARAGTAPVWAYLSLMTFNFLAPLAIFIVAAMFTTWVRHPRHVITWATVPFFAAHSLVSHKEIRYLFPMTLLATFFLILAVVPRDGQLPNVLRRLWDARGSRRAKLLYGLNLIVLAVLCLKENPSAVVVQKYIYDQYPHGCQLIELGEKTPYQNIGVNMFFYQPANLQITRVASRLDLMALLKSKPAGPLLLVADRHSTPLLQDLGVPHDALIYRTYPQWLESYNYFGWERHSEFFRLSKIDAPQAQLSERLAEKPRIELLKTENHGSHG